MKNEKEYIIKLDENAERRAITGYVTRSEDEGESMQTVSGVACVFDQETDMGWYIEKVDRNAFVGCDMTDVLALFNHDDDEILSRTTGQSDDLVLSVKTDGLHYSFKAKNECSKEVAENIKLGFVRGSSFGFIVDSNEWQFDVKQADGSVKDVRTITKIRKLFDVSPVTFPAYNQTSVALRSKEQIKKEIEPKQPSGIELRNQYKLEKLKLRNK